MMMALSVALGCAKGTNVLYPLHPRPDYPMAITSPDKVFLSCGDDYLCVSPEHLEGLRKFVIRQNVLIEKYEENIKLHNSSVN